MRSSVRRLLGGQPKDRAQRGSVEDLEAVVDEFWAAWTEYQPMTACYLGIHKHDHRLDSVLPEVHEAFAERCAALQQRLDALFPANDPQRCAGLGLNDRTTLFVLQHELERQVRGIALKSYVLEYVSILEAPHLNLPIILDKMELDDAAGFDLLLARFLDVPRFLREVEHMLEHGLEHGVSQPRNVIALAVEQVREMVTAKPSAFHEILEERAGPAKLPEARRAELERAIEQVVLPALDGYGDFLEGLLPRLSEETAMHKRMPERGAALYAHMIALHTTTTMDPDEIHQVGLDEVRRILAKMEEIASAEGFGDGPEGTARYQAHLAETHRAASDEELLRHYRELAMRIMPLLPKFFGKLPRTTFGICSMPRHSEGCGAGAYYDLPPVDGSGPGWVNINRSVRETYMAEALILHEGVPGHHLQTTLALENTELSEFRRLADFSAYSEGWGLYSEFLGHEMGLYAEPAAHFGRLKEEIFRACRLVVDTGLNHRGWTQERAVKFLLDSRCGSEHECATEVRRYVADPGQALSYKIGEIRLRELRAHAERELGPRFRLRDFHDLVLAVGAVPLVALEDIVRDWVTSEQARSSRN